MPESPDHGFNARYFAVLGAAVACYCALGIVLGGLPHYVRVELKGSPLLVGVAVGAPSLTGALLRPLGGRLADRIGPARIVMAGSVVMAVGVLPAFAGSIAPLLASRLVVGAGEALMMSAGVLWLLRVAGPDRRGVAIGHIGLANYAGLTVGPLLGSALGTRDAPDRMWVAAALLPLACLAVAASISAPGPSKPSSQHGPPATSVLRLTFRPGLGLLLVNFGYVAILSFGATATDAHHLHIGDLVVPLFAIGVIASRTLLAGIPDRWGGATTLTLSALIEACGLIVLALVPNVVVAVAALIVLAAGQGLAVPSLGLLALRRVPEELHGAAAGSFFAYFDGGVGLGGPAVGSVASAFDAPAALAVAGVAVAAAVPITLIRSTARLGASDGAPQRAGATEQ